MPEITPDLSDLSRCVSVHWSLPVQCGLPRAHCDNWHEAWHPQTGNRMRYRRTMGVFVTEEHHHDAWHDLSIPAPGVVCGEPHSHNRPGVFCQMEHGPDGSRWSHFALVDGCRYTWNTPHPKKLTVEQLTADVGALRSEVEELHASLTQSENDLMGTCLSLWEEEQDTARLRLALSSAQRGRRGLRARVAALLAERHSTNEAVAKADATAANARKLVSGWLTSSAEHDLISGAEAFTDAPHLAGVQTGRARQLNDCAEELRDVLGGDDPDDWEHGVSVEVGATGGADHA